MLSPQAWNAFLKTLEEPPPRTIFVLATTEAQKVLPTVVDRCHRFDFGRPSGEQVAAVVRRVAERESIEIDEGAAALIARHATGSFRDALGTLEQLVTYAGDETIGPRTCSPCSAWPTPSSCSPRSTRSSLAIRRRPCGRPPELTASGRDPGQVLRDLEVHGRELLTVQMLGEVPAELRVTPERDARLAQQAATLAQTDAVRLLELVSAALEATANGAQARIQLELVLIKAAAPEMDPSSGLCWRGLSVGAIGWPNLQRQQPDALSALADGLESEPAAASTPPATSTEPLPSVPIFGCNSQGETGAGIASRCS